MPQVGRLLDLQCHNGTTILALSSPYSTPSLTFTCFLHKTTHTARSPPPPSADFPSFAYIPYEALVKRTEKCPPRPPFLLTKAQLR